MAKTGNKTSKSAKKSARSTTSDKASASLITKAKSLASRTTKKTPKKDVSTGEKVWGIDLRRGMTDDLLPGTLGYIAANPVKKAKFADIIRDRKSKKVTSKKGGR